MKQRGFTLLEMVVSLGIVALVSLVLSQVFFATLRTNTKTERIKDVKQNGELALESISRMIQNAKRISSACSDSGVVSSSVTIVNRDDGETTFGCLTDGAMTRLASISAEWTMYLTSDDVTMGGTSCDASTLTFTCVGSVGAPISITISFSLTQSGFAGQAFEESSESFQTSATMRNITQ